MSKITSDNMRSILHGMMIKDVYYRAWDLHTALRVEVERIEASTNKRARPCRDWTQRVAQLLSNDNCISVRPGQRSWYYSNPNKYCLSIDENDIQFYIGGV